MKRINTYLTEKEIKELGKLAKQMGLTVAELIRRAIDKYLQEQE